MKVKIILGIVLLFFATTLWSQNAYGIDSVKVIVDSSVKSANSIVEDEEYESELEESKGISSNEDTIVKAVLETIDTTEFPILPVTTLNDTLLKLKKNGDYWYVNANFEEKKAKQSVQKESDYSWLNFFSSDVFRFIIWALLIGFAITVLMIFLNENDIKLFRKKSTSIKVNLDKEEREENIFETNFENAISKAVTNQNYSLATRLHYLNILLELHKKEVIIYSKEKTNFEYLMNVANKPIFADFSKATRNYEFVWYGDFELNKETYAIIETVFIKLQKQIQQL